MGCVYLCLIRLPLDLHKVCECVRANLRNGIVGWLDWDRSEIRRRSQGILLGPASRGARHNWHVVLFAQQSAAVIGERTDCPNKWLSAKRVKSCAMI